MNSFEHTGHWWLPHLPQDRIGGTLSFDGVDQAVLRLIGQFAGSAPHLDVETPPPMVVHGAIRNKLVTLGECDVTSTSWSGSGLQTCELTVGLVFLGQHLAPESGLRLSAMAVSYDGMIEWSGLSSIAVEAIPAEEGRSMGVSVTSRPRILEPIELGNAVLRFRTRWATHGSGISERTVTQRVFAEIEPSSPLSVREFLGRYFYHVQNFISLGESRPINTLAVLGHPTSEETVADEQETARKRAAREVEIIYASRRADGRSGSGTEPFFRRVQLGDYLGSSIRAWLEKAEILEPVYDLYFGMLYGHSSYLENQFLMLAQALETYHRRTSERTTYLPKATFKQLRLALVNVIQTHESLSEDLCTTFAGKLSFFNEISLRERIRDILNRVGASEYGPVLGAEAFVADVVNTRNYLTHYDQKSKANAAQGEKLWNLTDQLRTLLEQCLLIELGLPNEMRAAIMQSRPREFKSLSAVRSEVGG
jgi:ApeA N-terminal domain 1